MQINLLYDGSQLVAELNGDGSLKNVFGWSTAGLLERWQASSRVYYAYPFDPSGNLVQRISHSGFQQGTLADFTTLYDGYGAQLVPLQGSML